MKKRRGCDGASILLTLLGIEPAHLQTSRRRAFVLDVTGLLALFFVAHGVLLYLSAQRYSLGLRLRCETPLVIRVEADAGFEYGNSLTGQIYLPGSSGVQQARFSLPACRLEALRFHLRSAGRALRVGIGNVAIMSDADEALGQDTAIDPLSAARIVSAQRETGVDAVTQPGWALVAAGAEAADPACTLKLASPLGLEFNGGAFFIRLGIDFAIYLLAVIVAALWWGRSARLRQWHGAQWAWLGGSIGEFCRARPHRAIWLASVAGVLVSCYPVAFFGQSFVGPNMTLRLLYERLPTLPGYTDAAPGNNQLSDVAATMLQSVPWAAIQHRAIFQEGEAPLWNRHDAGGIPLLAQGLSMIGDPLQWIPLLADSASWAWDVKFLLARILFGAGIGLSVLAAARHLPAALLLAFCSCFIGFFIFRLNHSTYFSLSYAPWILYAWILLCRDGRKRVIGLLLLANWMEFNSGTAKESVILMLDLNACGALAFWLSNERGTREKRRLFLRLIFAGVCFTLMAAPLWLTTFDAITHSWNSYKVPKALQIQPGLVLGLFDDIYYRQIIPGERLYNPSLNFVILAGVGLTVSYCRSLVRNPLFVAMALGAIPSFCMVFGAIPEKVITAIPFLGNIVHVDTTFSCPLIINLLVLAGFGFRECRQRFAPAHLLAPIALLALMLVALGVTTKASVFCWAYSVTLVAGFIALPFCLRHRTGAFLALSLATLMWRNALHLPGLSFIYVMSPGSRADLMASSPAASSIRERSLVEPGRAMGFGSNLAPGFAGVYDLESPSGPDALQNPYYHDLLERSNVHYWSGWYLLADRPVFTNNRKFFDLLNVRYYLDGSNYLHSDLTSLGHFDLDVYQSESAWPRAFFVSAVSAYGALPEFYRQVLDGDGRPFVSVTNHEPIAVEVASLPHDGAARQIVPADRYRLTSNTTSFHIRAPSAGVVALVEGYQAHGAEVTLNGQSVPHFRVNHAFTGVYVPQAGDYTVSVRYWPRFLTAGLWLALAGGVVLIVSEAPGRPRNGRTPAPAGLDPAAAGAPTDAP